MSAEVALKAVLMRKGIFIDKPSGDRHHRIPELFEKIKKENCLSADMIENLESIVGDKNRGGLGYIRIVIVTGKLFECTAGQYPLFRYIFQEASPYDIVKENDAKEKVGEARLGQTANVNVYISFFCLTASQNRLGDKILEEPNFFIASNSLSPVMR